MEKSLYVLGGTTWINLVNTTYISNNQKIDIVGDYTSAVDWLWENKLLRKQDDQTLENKKIFDGLINELRSLRRLGDIILSELEELGEISSSTEIQLKSIVEEVKANLTIISQNQQLKLVFKGMTVKDHVIYKIIESIIYTLNGTPINRIRKCEHQECSLHFVDTSKSGKRRWCSMSLCGNRAKAERFYAKKKKK